MRETFTDYDDAKEYAQKWANQLNGTDVGIKKIKEYGKKKFLVLLLPSPEKSFGYERRCERVTKE
jgi:hypothetical protein